MMKMQLNLKRPRQRKQKDAWKREALKDKAVKNKFNNVVSNLMKKVRATPT